MSVVIKEIRAAAREVDKKLKLIPKVNHTSSDEVIKERLHIVSDMWCLKSAGLSTDTQILLKQIKQS